MKHESEEPVSLLEAARNFWNVCFIEGYAAKPSSYPRAGADLAEAISREEADGGDLQALRLIQLMLEAGDSGSALACVKKRLRSKEKARQD